MLCPLPLCSYRLRLIPHLQVQHWTKTGKHTGVKRKKGKAPKAEKQAKYRATLLSVGATDIRPVTEFKLRCVMQACQSLAESLKQWCVWKTYQTVQSSSKKVQCTCLQPSGGGWWLWADVQIKQISQEVSLGWNNSRRCLRDPSSGASVWAVNTLPAFRRKRKKEKS